MNNIVDMTLGIKPQARAVMAYLSDMSPDFAEYENGHYNVSLETKPWYNGRERGFVVSMAPGMDYARPAINIAVFEHRTGDQICVLEWESDSFSHFYNEVPGGGLACEASEAIVPQSFPYGAAGAAAAYVYARLSTYWLLDARAKLQTS